MSWFEQNKHKSAQEIAEETDAVFQNAREDRERLYDAVVAHAGAQGITQEVVDYIVEKEFTGDPSLLPLEQRNSETSKAIASFQMLAAAVEQESPALGKMMKDRNGEIISQMHAVIITRAVHEI